MKMPVKEMTFGYADLKRWAAESSYIRIKVALPVAMYLAEQSPYPRAVKVGIMKHVANAKYVTLSQLRVILGWSADRAQR